MMIIYNFLRKIALSKTMTRPTKLLFLALLISLASAANRRVRVYFDGQHGLQGPGSTAVPLTSVVYTKKKDGLWLARPDLGEHDRSGNQNVLEMKEFQHHFRAKRFHWQLTTQNGNVFWHNVNYAESYPPGRPEHPLPIDWSWVRPMNPGARLLESKANTNSWRFFSGRECSSNILM